MALPVLLVEPARAQTYELTWSTVDGGGEMYSTSPTYKLGGTIGQCDAGKLTSASYIVTGGFWVPILGGAPAGVAPNPEPGGAACATSEDCIGVWIGADCVAGTCYVPKNRYLSIDPTVNPEAVAYRVEIVEAADYPTAVGRSWWLDEPICHDYPNGNPDPNPDPPSCTGPGYFGWVSDLTDVPGSRIWNEVPLHITGCGLVPVITFEIRASADEGVSFSEPLVINTIHAPNVPQYWGDITGGPAPGMPTLWLPPEGSADFSDVSNAIRTFENRAEDTGFPPRVWVDVETDRVISFADIDFMIKAFAGTKYADLTDLPEIGWHPADCPADGRRERKLDAGPIEQPSDDREEMLPQVSAIKRDGHFEAPARGAAAPAEASLTLVAGTTRVRAGELVAVDVFATDVVDIGVYEVALDATGGATGGLTLEDLSIDTASDDFVFGNVEFLHAIDRDNGRLGAAAFAHGVDVVEPRYLGTFVFRAADDASGTFHVRLREGRGTFMRDGLGVPISFERGPAVAISVELVGEFDRLKPRRN